MTTNVVDVTIETNEGDFFQFLSVTEPALRAAVDKAQVDGTVLSLVSTISAALIVPWPHIKAVSFIPITVEEREGAWTQLWTRAELARQEGQASE